MTSPYFIKQQIMYTSNSATPAIIEIIVHHNKLLILQQMYVTSHTETRTKENMYAKLQSSYTGMTIET